MHQACRRFSSYQLLNGPAVLRRLDFWRSPCNDSALERLREVSLSRRPCPLACARCLVRNRAVVVIVGAAGSCQVNACCVVALDVHFGPISCPRRRADLWPELLLGREQLVRRGHCVIFGRVHLRGRTLWRYRRYYRWGYVARAGSSLHRFLRHALLL